VEKPKRGAVISIDWGKLGKKAASEALKGLLQIEGAKRLADSAKEYGINVSMLGETEKGEPLETEA
jgi:hypothetical protein